MHLNIYNFLHKILIIYDNIYMERERDLLILNNNKTRKGPGAEDELASCKERVWSLLLRHRKATGGF